jgi:hypothetical protein
MRPSLCVLVRGVVLAAAFAVPGLVPAPAAAQNAAARLYQQACDGGDAEACYLLGRMYEIGTGVAEDEARALRLYQRGCEGGSEPACDRLPDRPGQDVFVEAGTVADAQTGEPLNDAIVEVAELRLQAISGEDGQVELPAMPAGRHSVRVERAGYQVMEGEIEVPGLRDFTAALSPSLLDDPTAPGRILGRVLEEGIPVGLGAVDVSLIDRPTARAISDPRGNFSLTDVEPGLVELRLERLGYAPRTTYLIVQPEGTVEIDATMSTEPFELDPIEVTVQSEYLRRMGFFRRQRQVAGYTFTRDELEELPLFAPGDVVNYVPGMRAQRGGFGGTVLLGRSGGRECVLVPYLDGVRMEGLDVDILRLDWLEGVEVYRRFMPPEYLMESSRPSTAYNAPTCGIVLFWTRRDGARD